MVLLVVTENKLILICSYLWNDSKVWIVLVVVSQNYSLTLVLAMWRSFIYLYFINSCNSITITCNDNVAVHHSLKHDIFQWLTFTYFTYCCEYNYAHLIIFICLHFFPWTLFQYISICILISLNNLFREFEEFPLQ